jgi:hypothetical protein
MPALGPTNANLADDFEVESLLAIIRRHRLCVHLADDGERILYSIDVPIWIARAVEIHEADLLPLMRSEFLGPWRCAE